MKEEIIGGLKNALERGAPLEKAINSFIAAGYNPDEVRAAATELNNLGVTSVLNPKNSFPAKLSNPLSNNEVPSPNSQQQGILQKSSYDEMIEDNKAKKGFKFKMFLIVFLILMLLFVGASVAIVMFFPTLAEKILSYLP